MNSSAKAARSKRRHGFTVIELVVAITIAAMVLVAVTTAMSRIGHARQIARVRLAAHQRANEALEAIRQDISTAIRSDDLFSCRVLITPGSRPSRVGPFERDSLLVFNTRLRPVRDITYNGEGLEYETQYKVMDDRSASILWRRRDPVPDDNPEGGGVVDPVAEGILSVRFEAYDDDGWHSEWDSDTDGIPMAIRASVEATGVAEGEDALASPELIVALRTVVPIDRVPPPHDPAADAQAAADAAAANAADAAAAQGASLTGAAGTGAAGGAPTPDAPGAMNGPNGPRQGGGNRGQQGGGLQRGGGGARGGGGGGGGPGGGGGARGGGAMGGSR